MAISYPLAFPVEPKPSAVRWYEGNVIGLSVNPASLQAQIFDWEGDTWGVEIGWDPLSRVEAAPISGFLSALRGKFGTFLFGDILMAVPQGAGGGTPLLMGASAKGARILATDGWPNSTLVLKAGDRIQVGNSLYKILQDATTNGSGQATLDIWPSSRGHANDAQIITSEPKCLFRLRENIISPDDEPNSQCWNVSIIAEEAL